MGEPTRTLHQQAVEDKLDRIIELLEELVSEEGEL